MELAHAAVTLGALVRVIGGERLGRPIVSEMLFRQKRLTAGSNIVIGCLGFRQVSARKGRIPVGSEAPIVFETWF